MNKKYLIIVMLMVMTFSSVVAGTWKIHNYYLTSRIQNVVDAGDRVYYLNTGGLYQYEKATQVTTALNRQNLLSDDNIRQIFYDADRKLLFIAYHNCNIDVLDANNHKVNINHLKTDLTRIHGYTFNTDDEDHYYELNGYIDKLINDINFVDGKAYVATGIGYATIDETTFNIIEDRTLGTTANINSVTVLNNELMVILSNSFCYYGPVGADDPIRTFRKQSASLTGGKIVPIDDNSAFILGNSALFNYNFSGSTPTVLNLVSAKPTCVQKSPNGYIANFEGKKYYYTIDPTGKTATKVSSVLGFASSYPEGDGTVWINDANGLHVENSTDYHAINSLTTDRPYWLKYNTAMNLLYAGVSSRNGNTVLSSDALPDNVINTYNGSQWEDATAYTASGAGYEFVFSPLDSTTYVRAGWVSGVHKVTNNVMKLNYNQSNSMVGHYKPHPAFDKYGNLWTVRSLSHRSDTFPDGKMTPPVAVLPKDKFARNTSSKSDWFLPSGLWGLNTGKMQRSRFLISKLNNLKIYSDCDYRGSNLEGCILCWDNFNVDPTVDNYRFRSIASFTDQNNKNITWLNLSHMEEDADGLIWVGHITGLFAFDPNGVFDDKPKAFSPYVTKASKEADLGPLCEGYTVYDIAIDRYNNKWLATDNGLYFTSPDGSTIYEHFTTVNSDIPSNSVYSVECDPIHNRVYIYTDNAFAEYLVEGNTAAIDFENVYTYPDPVSPDFTGMIKIGNLMADSYVTIADKNGHIVKQLGPVTGSALWDGCGTNGDRVPTGIYNIYAAQGSQPVATGSPRTTVLIIK